MNSNISPENAFVGSWQYRCDTATHVQIRMSHWAPEHFESINHSHFRSFQKVAMLLGFGAGEKLEAEPITQRVLLNSDGTVKAKSKPTLMGLGR